MYKKNIKRIRMVKTIKNRNKKSNKKAQSSFEYMMVVSIFILGVSILLYSFNIYSTHSDLQSQIYKAKQSVDSLKNAVDFAYLYAPSKSSNFIYLPPSTGDLIIDNRTITIRINYYDNYTDVFSIAKGNINVVPRNCTADKRDVNPCKSGCDCGGRSYKVCVRSHENGTVDLRFGISCSITADAGDNKLICANESTPFDGGYSYSDENIILYEWDFGDGENATGVFVNHTYKNPSTYIVTLKITDNNTATDSTKITVKVKPINQPPNVNFTVSPADNASVCQIVTFNASGSYDADGSITLYNWIFSDGVNINGSSLTSVSRSFTLPGNYTVTLIIYDDGGCGGVKSESISKSINIKNILPEVHIAYPQNNSSLNCTTLNITGTASDACNGSVTSVLVKVDSSGDTANGTINWSYIWTPQINGNHTICVNATDNDNESTIICNNITVFGCIELCTIELVPNSVKTYRRDRVVGFNINNTGSQPQTIAKMNVTWATDAKLLEVKIKGNSVWKSNSGVDSGTEIDINDTEIDVGTNSVKLGFDKSMEGKSINITFILNTTAKCSSIKLNAPVCGNITLNETEINNTRKGWKNYSITINNGSACNSSNKCNCTGPYGWTDINYSDSSWSDLNLSFPYINRCDYCDFFFRKHIYINGTPVNVSFKVGSDDWFEIFVNNINITNNVNVYGHVGCSNILGNGYCHKSCCYGSGCKGNAESDPEGWHDITQYMSEGDNIVAIHLSECTGQEYFDMIFNITYIPDIC